MYMSTHICTCAYTHIHINRLMRIKTCVNFLVFVHFPARTPRSRLHAFVRKCIAMQAFCARERCKLFITNRDVH